MKRLQACCPGLAVAWCVVALGAATLAAEPAPPPKPNILWITCEDMSPNLGCYGDAYATTPNLDRLAGQAVRYTHAFATASVCSPARSCLITGLYATSLGTQNLRSAFPVPAAIHGFPTYLRRAGYFTTNNVKTDYNLADEPAFIRESWDRCDAQAHWRQRRPGQPFFSVFNIMDTHQSRSNVWSFDEFEKQIGSKLSAAQRHDPAKAPVPPFYADTPLVRRTLARYYDCITAMDQQVGNRLRQLDDDGLAGDTIVFFFADGGMGLPRGKRTNYDTGLRVPLLIRFPERLRRLAPVEVGQTTDRLVSFVDFAPSVLSLVGLPAPPYMQGQAFLGPTAGEPRQYVFGARDRVDEAFELSRSVRDSRWLYIRNYLPHLSWMQPEGFSDQSLMRQEMATLASAGKLNAAQLTYAGPTKPREELYDSVADPVQLHNLAGAPEHQAELKRLRERLGKWMAETRDLGFLTECEMAARCGKEPPYDWARRKGTYPQDRIREAAKLVGQADEVFGVVTQQANLLNDHDSAVRYWAAVGLHAQGRHAALARRLLPDVADSEEHSPPVRIEVAASLAAGNSPERPLKLLVAELRGDNPHAALLAARALELLGSRARPVLPQMREMLKLVQQPNRAGDANMFLEFALKGAIERLD